MRENACGGLKLCVLLLYHKPHARACLIVDVLMVRACSVCTYVRARAALIFFSLFLRKNPRAVVGFLGAAESRFYFEKYEFRG